MSSNIKLRPDFRILYFSGTGNTHWVVEKLKLNLKDRGFRVFNAAVDELRAQGPERMAEALKKLAQPETTLILAFPAYACDLPAPVREILELLPPVQDCNLAVIATVYRTCGDAHRLPGRALAPKGYLPILEAYVKMPNNLKLPRFEQFEILNGEQLKNYHQTAGVRVNELAAELAEGWRDENGPHLGELLSQPAYRLSDAPLKKLFAARMFADARCIKCTLCASACPVANISFAGGYPEFGENCCGCLRCYSFCPVSAIQISEATFDQQTYPRYRGFNGWHPARLREVTKGDRPGV